MGVGDVCMLVRGGGGGVRSEHWMGSPGDLE